MTDVFNNNSITSTNIDNINYGQSFNILSRGNASDYTSLISHEDLLKLKMSNQVKAVFNPKDHSFEKFLVMLSNVYQSITTKGLTTPEIVKYIIDSFKNEQMGLSEDEKLKVLKEIQDYIAIFQIDFNEGNSSASSLKIQQEVLKAFTYSSNSLIKNYYGSPIKGNPKNFNTNQFLNFANKNGDKDNDLSESVNSKIAKPDKENPNLSVILMNNRNLRSGVKNALELSTFFNLIPSLEYAKAYPFFNATFILPSISKQDVNGVFKTATLNQFLFGGTSKPKNKNFNSFEATVVKDNKNVGVKTNLAVFTTPQTFVNMDEKVGHRDGLSEKEKRLRITSIHDQTQPFMTLKDFTIDVSPTKGLMSFKTGKMSLVLHDRTRMVDIAPFIKPDLFGAFGAEIVVEYGWNHNESQSVKDINTRNPIGAFLHSSRCIEKYMIVNSQFSIENNGEVNINLSIAMKGPIDVRQTEIFADAVKQIEQSELSRAISYYKMTVGDATGDSNSAHDFNTVSTAFTNLYNGKSVAAKDIAVAKKIKKRIESAIGVYESSIKLLKGDNVGNNYYSFNVSGSLNQSQISNFNQIFGLRSPFGLRKEVNDLKLIIKDKGDFDFNKASVLSIKLNLENIVKVIQRFINRNDVFNREKRDFIQSLIGGTKDHDMFFDNRLIGLINKKKSKSKSKSKTKNNSVLEDIAVTQVSKSSHVSLGTIISSLVSTHMARSGKYDEIQLVFNTVNDKAGLASSYLEHVNSDIYNGISRPLNIASLLVERSSLRKFLEKLFNERTRLTLESLISQIITNFVITRDNPCYGLSNLFTREDFDFPVKPKSKASSSLKTLKSRNVKDRLNYIYYKEDKNLHDPDPSFLPPSIHLTFDALTTTEDLDRTICRITIYDRNDNPYQSICDIYNERFLSRSRDYRKLKQIEHLIKNNSKSKNSRANASLENEAKRLIRNLVGEDGIFEKDGNGYRFKSGFGFDDLKEKYKKIVPAATFATQNSSLINASVATVNEGKLNTVYITRSDRNNKYELNNKVLLDSPLRILPAQASIEMFGCPWINFGQYIFLDFETGTTLDNTYAVTGVKHTIMPGKFSTQVSLSYGDAYGRYEGMADGFSRSLQKFGEPVEEKQQNVNTESNVASVVFKRNEQLRRIRGKANKFYFSIKNVFFNNADFDAKEVLMFLIQNSIYVENKEVISYSNAKRNNKELGSLLSRYKEHKDPIENIKTISSKLKLLQEITKLLKEIYEVNSFLDVYFTKVNSTSKTGYNFVEHKRREYKYVEVSCYVLKDTQSEFSLKIENKLNSNELEKNLKIYEKSVDGIKVITGFTPEEILTKNNKINKESLKILIDPRKRNVDVKRIK